MKDILVPISPGELLDKITILRIKQVRILDAAKLANVKLELALLEQTWRDWGGTAQDVALDERALQNVNERLWTSRIASGTRKPNSASIGISSSWRARCTCQ